MFEATSVHPLSSAIFSENELLHGTVILRKQLLIEHGITDDHIVLFVAIITLMRHFQSLSKS